MLRTKNKKSFYIRHKEGITAFLLLLIPIGWWLVISGYPIIFGLSLGFMNWSGLVSKPTFAGIDNFIIFFKNDLYLNALKNTVTLGGLCFIFSTVLGCLAALLLNKINKGQGIFRMIWYIPAVTSGVATSQIFKILMDSPEGVINNIIIGFGGQEIYWQFSTFWMVVWICIYAVWGSLGNSTLIWLAALQSIDRSIMESGKLDGCNNRQLFFKLAIPQMMPLITFILISGFIGAMNIYEPVLFISSGEPYGATEVLAYRIMRAAFWDNDFGMAGCASFILMLITIIFSVFIFKNQIQSYRVNYKK